jgi:hypothetical protein
MAHLCVVERRRGATRCWGSNAHGKLGDGTRENRPLPTMIHGLR